MEHAETLTEAIERKQSELEDDIVDTIIEAVERSLLGGKLKAEAIRAAANRAANLIASDA